MVPPMGPPEGKILTIDLVSHQNRLYPVKNHEFRRKLKKKNLF